jgi:hypothetical protein
VVDALAGYGVTHIELPLTSEKVWRAMHAATMHTARAPSPPS